MSDDLWDLLRQGLEQTQFLVCEIEEIGREVGDLFRRHRWLLGRRHLCRVGPPLGGIRQSLTSRRLALGGLCGKRRRRATDIVPDAGKLRADCQGSDHDE